LLELLLYAACNCGAARQKAAAAMMVTDLAIYGLFCFCCFLLRTFFIIHLFLWKDALPSGLAPQD
jgi:hypothetical protein